MIRDRVFMRQDLSLDLADRKKNVIVGGRCRVNSRGKVCREIIVELKFIASSFNASSRVLSLISASLIVEYINKHL